MKLIGPLQAGTAVARLSNNSVVPRRRFGLLAATLSEFYMDDFGLNENDLEMVKGIEDSLLKRVIKSPDEARRQAVLWWVIWRGSIEQLREILAAGANPNFVYNNTQTPLGLVIHWRSEKNSAAKFFRELAQAGADPTCPSENKSLMSIACEHGNTQWAIEPLLEFTPGGKLPQADLNRALLAAVDNVSLAKQLLTAGAFVNHQQTINNAFIHTSVSALMLASFVANPHVVELLLTSGAAVNLKDGEGHSALDYAKLDPRRCRKIIALLEKAGGVSAKPFSDDDQFREFAKAARKPAYKQAVAKIQKLTGVKPSPLVSEDGKIPGGQGFLFDRDLGQKLVEGGYAEFAAHADPVREFVERHQGEMLAQGYYLFYSHDIVSKNGDVVALLPTSDVYRVIEALETNGQNSTDNLIAWLRELEKEQPFVIIGIGPNFIDGKFTTPIKNPAGITERINGICPDDSLTSAEKAAQIDRLRVTNRLYLWWD